MKKSNDTAVARRKDPLDPQVLPLPPRMASRRPHRLTPTVGVVDGWFTAGLIVDLLRRTGMMVVGYVGDDECLDLPAPSSVPAGAPAPVVDTVANQRQPPNPAEPPRD